MPAGPDHRGVVLPLLDALAAMGREDEAQRLRQSFEARDWDLQQADVARVLGLLSAPRQQELPLGASAEKPPPVAREDHPDDPSFIRLYRPFLESIPAWRDLLDATNQLLSARSWEALGAACEEVFCGALGFDDDRVPLTHRLRGKSAVEVFEQLGSFKGFRVCLVRLTRSLSDTRWSNMSEHYRPCFRLVPRALLISYEPGSGAIRLVFRQRHGRTDTRPRYRCIVGPWFLRDSQENLLTICRRLELCRPQFDEDSEGYGRRVQAALECDVGALATAWTSGPLPSSGELPGLPMHTATTELMHSFLHAPGWQWGLAGHLGNLFPLPLKYGDAWLDLDGVDLVDEPADPDACWRQARSREQRLRLRLLIRSWDTLEERESFEIMTALLVPDDEGWFWLEGTPYRHLPQAGADGRLLRRNALPDWVNQADAVDDEDDDDATEELEHFPLTTAEGAVVDSVIGRAVERRLWRLIRYLRRKTKDSMNAGQVRATLLATIPPGEALPLLTLTAARSLMTPIDLARPEREMTDVVSTTEDFITEPPAWACVDVSADLEAHRWAVVAGARVHPTGGLAVPSWDEDGLRLRVCTNSAFDVNPRLGAGLEGERTWWIHWRLASFASLSPGRLTTAARVASVGHTLRGQFLSSSAVKRAHVAPWVRPRGPMLRTSVDVPKVVNLDGGEPIFLVSPGQTLPAGGPWLQIPGRHLAHDHDEAPSNLAALIGDHLDHTASSALVERSPWDCDTVVVRTGVTPVLRSGSLVGWRAWMQALMHGERAPSVVLASGEVSAIEPGWHPEELPYSMEGEVANVVLPGPAGDALCFSGADGQVVLANRIESATVLPPIVPIQERAALGAVDRLPRPGVRSEGEPWSWTRLRWLAEGVDSAWAPSTQGALLHHELLAWCAGIGPAPGDLTPETVAEVPISSRPHRVHQQLSTIRFRAMCGCGTLTGGELLGARCSSCGRPVEPLEVVEKLRQCTLPMVVVHPWAKEVVAAILGLIPSELETLLIRHGPQPVLDACHAALDLGPSDHAMSRLRLPATHERALKGQTGRRLGQMAELLSIPECARELADRVSLERVGLPTLDLVKIGNTLGELKPTGSRLMAAYARLYGACWAVQQAMRLDSAPLLATAQVQLQACVDAVFGDGAERCPETLAGLLRATSPWSRPAAPSIMARRPARASFPDNALWWQQRARRAQVIEHHAMELVAIVWTLPGLPAPERWQGVRAVARDLLDEQHDLAGLLELLHKPRGRPLQLPTDWEQARAALDARLRPALGEQSLAVVVPALGGWWMGEISDEHPSGAVWLPPLERGPDGFRRRLPPLSHMAWRIWPGLRAARPELGLGCLLGHRTLHLPLDVVSATVIPPADVVEELRVEVSAEPADEAVMVPNHEEAMASAAPSPVAEPTNPTESRPASEDISVVHTTLREWLEHR